MHRRGFCGLPALWHIGTVRYRDFNLRIVGKNAEGYDVRVDSPAGSARARVALDIEQVRARVAGLGQTLRSARAAREAIYDAPRTASPSEIGAMLHDALLSGGVRKMYDRSWGEVLRDPDAGLRIKLHLDLDNPDVRPLAQLPWEFAYDASSREFLAQSRQTPIVRYIDVPQRLNACAFSGTLRILVVMASPRGHAQLDLAKERRLIESTWAGDDRVEVEFLEQPTKSALLSALVDRHFHVLHFMGHGAFDAASGQGALVLEDEAGEADMLDAVTFGAWLRDAPRLRLVVLNACDTGKAGGDHPFAGVANRLVMVGLPAVVAMQFPISDEAAIEFARTFYSRLIKGFPVDEATQQGRKAIMKGPGGAVEWATPVLYMRAPDGRLFDPAEAAAPAPVAAVAAPPAQPGGYDVTILAHTALVVIAANALAVMSAHRFTRFPAEVRELNVLVAGVAVAGILAYAVWVLWRSRRGPRPLANTLLAFAVATAGIHFCLLSAGATDIYFSSMEWGDYTLTLSYGAAAFVLAIALIVLQWRASTVAFSLAQPMAWLILLIHGLSVARHARKAATEPDWFTGEQFGFGNTLQLTVALCAIVLAIAYLVAAWRFPDPDDPVADRAR